MNSLKPCYPIWRSRYGNDERVYRLEFVSNSDFTDSEFAKWKETVMLQGLVLPTAYEIQQKLKDIKQAIDHKFNEEDVDLVSIDKQLDVLQP